MDYQQQLAQVDALTQESLAQIQSHDDLMRIIPIICGRIVSGVETFCQGDVQGGAIYAANHPTTFDSMVAFQMLQDASSQTGVDVRFVTKRQSSERFPHIADLQNRLAEIPDSPILFPHQTKKIAIHLRGGGAIAICPVPRLDCHIGEGDSDLVGESCEKIIKLARLASARIIPVHIAFEPEEEGSIRGRFTFERREFSGVDSLIGLYS